MHPKAELHHDLSDYIVFQLDTDYKKPRSNFMQSKLGTAKLIN